jgi:hypothetical protein
MFILMLIGFAKSRLTQKDKKVLYSKIFMSFKYFSNIGYISYEILVYCLFFEYFVIYESLNLAAKKSCMNEIQNDIMKMSALALMEAVSFFCPSRRTGKDTSVQQETAPDNDT